MKIYRLLPTILLLSVLLLVGCSRDEQIGGGTLPGDEEVELTLTLRVPGVASPTRAMDETAETTIQTIDVVVFGEVAGVERYLYHTHATDILPNGGNRDKKFKTLLRTDQGNTPQRIFLLANLRNEISQVKAGFSPGMTPDELLQNIRFGSGQWNAASPSDFMPIPMWGMAAQSLVIDENTEADDIGTIPLLRSLARIDVGIKLDVNDVPEGVGDLFKITDIKVYNTHSLSAAAPLLANYDQAAEKVTAPTLAAGGLPNPNLTYSLVTPGDALIREIYIGEVANAAVAADADATCLLLGGYYSDPSGPPNTTDKSWYRLDFFDKTQTGNVRLDILRNHRYRFNITSVDGPGYPDESTAFNSKPFNMQTEIIIWDEGDLNEIEFNGQYMLAVTSSTVNLRSEGFAKPFTIHTTHPQGWRITSKPDWVQLSQDNDNSGAPVQIEISADPLPVPMTDRTGDMTIVAGNLTKRIVIRQDSQTEMMIEVTPTELSFRKTPGAGKTFTVTTVPANIPRNFTSTGNITWQTFPADNTTETVYTLTPAVNNTGNPLSGVVTVFIQNGGTTLSKDINVTQSTEDIIFGVTVNNPYPAPGGSSLSFNVNSTVPWRVSGKTDPNNMITLSTQDEQPAGNNLSYLFSLTANGTFAQRTATLHITSSDPDFGQRDVEIIQTFGALSLEITDPAGGAPIDFGTSNATRTLRFNVNSSWSYSVSGGYNSVVASADKIQGTTYPGGSAGQMGSGEVTFTPVYATSGTGQPQMGSEYTGTVIVATVPDPPTLPISKSVTVKRTVPGFFAFGSVSPSSGTIPQAGRTITVKASSNASWQAVPSFGNPETAATGTYAQKTLTVTIPANTSSGSRTVTVSTVDYAGNSVVRGTYTQTGGNSVTNVSHNVPSPIPANGGVYTMQFTGDFQAMTVRSKEYGTATILHSATLPANTSFSSVNIEVPRNSTGNDRQVEFEYEIASGDWRSIVVQAQPAANVKLSNRKLVAVQDAGIFNWATALGIRTEWNNKIWSGSSRDPYSTETSTGCAKYSEPGLSNWRAPTTAEMLEMYGMRAQLGLPSTGFYWSAENSTFSINGGYGVNMQTGFDNSQPKANLNPVRCVTSGKF